MIGFTLQRHPSFKLPEEHLRALERLLELLVQQFLTLRVYGK